MRIFINMNLKKYVPNNILYRMKNGEEIKDVANKFNTTIDNILLKSVDQHYEGEFVEIINTNQFSHTVKPLEDLNFIAAKYNVTINHIIEANNLKSKRLFIGQKLRF